MRELRQHASRYLERVKAGETVEVTERGQLVALLVPPTAASTARERLVASGRLLPAARPLNLPRRMAPTRRAEHSGRTRRSASRSGVIYLASSALLTLLHEEAESAALEHWLRANANLTLVSSELARIEVMRACRRVNAEALPEARALLGSIDLVPISTDIISEATEVGDASLRSLDAIHLASALSIRDELSAPTSHGDPDECAQQAEGEGLGPDQPGDVGPSSAQAAAQAKLGCPLEHGHEHRGPRRETTQLGLQNLPVRLEYGEA